MFNVIRGGIFNDQYQVSKTALLEFIQSANKSVYNKLLAFLTALNETSNYNQLLAKVAGVGNPQLVRLLHSYLPLTFGRRHGDPSRIPG